MSSRSAQDLPLIRTTFATGRMRIRVFDLAGHEAAAASLDCARPAAPAPVKPPGPKATPDSNNSTNGAMASESDGCQIAGALGARPSGAPGARATA